MRRGTCDPPLVAIYFGDATPLDVPVGGTSVPLVRKRDLLYSVTRCPPFEKEATVLGDLPRLGKRRSREIALVAVCVHPARDFGNARTGDAWILYDPRDGALPTCTGLVRLHVHREERMCVKKGIAGLKPPAAPK